MNSENRLFDSNVNILFVKPETEHVGLSAVRLPLLVVLIFLLWEWHTRDEADKNIDEKGGDEGCEAHLNIASDEIKTPPHDNFTEIIWVSRISPEAGFDELTSAWSWVCKVILKLFVGEILDQEAHEPNSKTNII